MRVTGLTIGRNVVTYDYPIVEAIASTGGALPEVIGDAGLLVEPGDLEGWREALERMDRYSTLAAGCTSSSRDSGMGSPGLVLAGLYACYTFSKYATLWELRRADLGAR